MQVIAGLSGIRGENWQGLLDRALERPMPSLDCYAFVLMMVRLARCEACQADSYRAVRGCQYCAQQTVKRYPGSDRELVARFGEAQQDVELYLREKQIQLG